MKAAIHTVGREGLVLPARAGGKTRIKILAILGCTRSWASSPLALAGVEEWINAWSCDFCHQQAASSPGLEEGHSEVEDGSCGSRLTPMDSEAGSAPGSQTSSVRQLGQERTTR